MTIARTIRDKLEGIVTYWTFRHISNAKMDGIQQQDQMADQTGLWFQRS